jgi:uncharacterized membrane protein YgcG
MVQAALTLPVRVCCLHCARVLTVRNRTIFNTQTHNHSGAYLAEATAAMQAAQNERAEVDLNSKLLLDAQLVLSQARSNGISSSSSSSSTSSSSSSSSSSTGSSSSSSSSVVQRIERALQHMIAAGVQPDDVSFIGMIEACAERQVSF